MATLLLAGQQLWDGQHAMQRVSLARGEGPHERCHSCRLIGRGPSMLSSCVFGVQVEGVRERCRVFSFSHVEGAH
eukprot:8372016-Lingulodinium_polyedra.AAC.1